MFGIKVLVLNHQRTYNEISPKTFCILYLSR